MLMTSRSDLPKFASNNRNDGTSDEYKAIVQGSIAHFGTYTVNEADMATPGRTEANNSAEYLMSIAFFVRLFSLDHENLIQHFLNCNINGNPRRMRTSRQSR